MSKTHKATRNNARQFIDKRLNFKTGGSLSGYEIGSDPYNGSYGRLPEEFRESCRWADYRVYSYVTPIAWWSEENGWTRPDVSYSPTTSRHQGLCPRSTHHCEHKHAKVTCGNCGRHWCDACDPSPAAQCHYCHGRGYSTAAL